MTPLYIFDLDGTLALIDHRRHLVERDSCSTCRGVRVVKREPVQVDPRPVPDRHGQPVYLPVMDTCPTCEGSGKQKPNWPAFFRACVDDAPNWPVIATMHALLKSGADVQIWSGRSAEVMNETLTWLHRWVFGGDIDADEVQLVMRREGDFTPDEQLKAGWHDALSELDRRRLVAVFDDRQKVVDMWRSKGVACFQVAPGEF